MSADVTVSLDLGCGAKPKNYFGASILYGIDIRNDLDNNVVKADLAIQPIPFKDNAFDFVTAHDFIEHVPRVLYLPERRNSFVELMSEIWRVLKAGGKFLSVTPAYPHPAAFRDPTHVNIIAEDTYSEYFCGNEPAGRMYGFVGGFNLVSQNWNGPYLVTIMECVK